MGTYELLNMMREDADVEVWLAGRSVKPYETKLLEKTEVTGIIAENGKIIIEVKTK